MVTQKWNFKFQAISEKCVAAFVYVPSVNLRCQSFSNSLANANPQKNLNLCQMRSETYANFSLFLQKHNAAITNDLELRRLRTVTVFVANEMKMEF